MVLELIQVLSAAGSEYTITNKKLRESLDEFEDLLEKYSVTKAGFIFTDCLQVEPRLTLLHASDFVLPSNDRCFYIYEILVPLTKF